MHPLIRHFLIHPGGGGESARTEHVQSSNLRFYVLRLLFIIYKLMRHVSSRNLVVELACNGAAYDVNVKIICSSFQKLS
jgi:hypothetical protein